MWKESCHKKENVFIVINGRLEDTKCVLECRETGDGVELGVHPLVSGKEQGEINSLHQSLGGTISQQNLVYSKRTGEVGCFKGWGKGRTSRENTVQPGCLYAAELVKLFRTRKSTPSASQLPR